MSVSDLIYQLHARIYPFFSSQGVASHHLHRGTTPSSLLFVPAQSLDIVELDSGTHHVDNEVRQLSRVISSKVIAAAFDQEDVCVELAMQLLQRQQVC